MVDYKKAYNKYHKSPKYKKDRAARNKARRKALKEERSRRVDLTMFTTLMPIHEIIVQRILLLLIGVQTGDNLNTEIEEKLMPDKLKKKLKAKANKKGFKGKKADAYVYGTMRKTGWKPKKEKT